MIHQSHHNRIISMSLTMQPWKTQMCYLTGELIQTLLLTWYERGICASWCFALSSQVPLTNEATDSLSAGDERYWCLLLLPKGSLGDEELQFYFVELYKHFNDFGLKLWGSNTKTFGSGLTWNQFSVCLKIRQTSSKQCSLAEVQIPTEILKTE